MKTLRFFLCAVSVFITATGMARQNNHERNDVLQYNRPAAHWLEALPLGNSHLGAMVYGGTDTEQIQLNEETFWSGAPHDNNSLESKNYLQQVRDSIFAGKEEVAADIINKHFLPGPHGMRFLTLGSVKLDFEDKGEVTGYSRNLKLYNASVNVDYQRGGVTYHRQAFASMDDNVLVVRLWTDGSKTLSFKVGHECVFETRHAVEGDCLVATIDGVEQEGIKAGLKAECRAKVTSNGKVTADGEQLRVTDASEAVI